MSYLQIGGGSLKSATGPLTVYVNADSGNDSNKGTIGSPFLTPLKAWNTICGIYGNSFNAIIQLQDSTAHFGPINYDITGSGNTTALPTGWNTITIIGNTSDETKCIMDGAGSGVGSSIYHAALAFNGGFTTALVFTDITITGTSRCIYVQGPFTIQLAPAFNHRIRFSLGGSTGAQFFNGCNIAMGGIVNIINNGTTFLDMSNCSVFWEPITANKTNYIGSPTFTKLIAMDIGAYLETTLGFNNRTTGTYTGTTLTAANASRINTLGASISSTAITNWGGNGHFNLTPGVQFSDLQGGGGAAIPTVAQLTAAIFPQAAGFEATVSDSNATLTAGIGAVVAGVGVNVVPVVWDGTNWLIG